MGKFFVCLLGFLFCHSLGFALDAAAEVKVSYFYPTNKEFRDTLDEGGVNYGLEGFVGIWKGWKVFLGVDYFHEKNKAKGVDDSVSVMIVPISAGIRYDFCPLPNSYWNFYLAAGPTYHMLRIKNDSEFEKSRICKESFGGVAKTGVFVTPYECLVIDLFFDFTYNKMSFSGTSHGMKRRDLYLSGVKGGVGLGYQF